MRRAVVRPENTHQATLLRLLRDDGPRSRAELGDAVDLSRTTLAEELERLRANGLVEDGGPAASRGGRRSSIVRLSSQLLYAALDVGATSVDVAVTDGYLNVLAHRCVPFDVRKGPRQVLGVAVDLLAKVRADVDGGELQAVGVGVPGPVSFREGVPVAPPLMPGWDRFPVREELARELGCPVVVDNDVNVMAVGERHGGVARSVGSFLFVKVGTGIGCGVVVDGSVYRGVDGSAGDIGHIGVQRGGPACACGRDGCLETVFGGAALARDALQAARSGRSAHLAELLEFRGPGAALDAADVGAAAAAGDPVALGLVRDGGRRLGEVLAALVSFFNPGLVVIGGGVAGLGHTLLAEVRSVVYRRSLPLATRNLPIVLSELGGSAGVVGGAVLASDHLLTPTSDAA